MKSVKLFIFICSLSISVASAQFSKVIPFRQPGTDGSTSQAYQPMPVIFVHGIGSDRSTWSNALVYLQPCFSLPYAWTNSPVLSGGGQDVVYQLGSPSDNAYLQTYDYGTYGAGSNMVTTWGHRQTFDSIASNAWFGVASSIENTLGVAITLDGRINGVNGVRELYQYVDGSKPPVVLACHSEGGVVAHYYLTQSLTIGIDPGVARLVTFGSPHGGSTICNWMRSKYHPDNFLSFLRLPKTALIDTPLFTAIGMTPNSLLKYPSETFEYYTGCTV